MALIQLIYVSSSTQDLSESELDRILATSVRNNSAQGITGILLYSQGNFMQILEGEEDDVQATFDRVCQDTRHDNIFMLSREPRAQRQFGNWKMGFHRLTPADATAHPEYAHLFANGFDPEQLSAEWERALQMIAQFG